MSHYSETPTLLTPEKAKNIQKDLVKNKENQILKDLINSFNKEIEKQDPNSNRISLTLTYSDFNYISKAPIDSSAIEKFIQSLKEFGWSVDNVSISISEKADHKALLKLDIKS